MKYYAIAPAKYDDSVILVRLPNNKDNPNLPKTYKYQEGIPLLKDYPERKIAVMEYDEDHKNEGREELYDFLSNLDRALVVNSKVKSILENLKIENLEYLPITLSGYDKKTVAADYYIINPVGSVEFIDMNKSEYRIDPLDDEQIDRIKNLVINTKAVSEKDKFFRATTMTQQVFISEEIKQAFEDAKIQGYKLFEAEGWDGLPV